MRTKTFVAAMAVFLLVFSSLALAGYDVELRNLEVTDDNVCQGESVTAEVTVEVECPESDVTLYWYVDGDLVASEVVSFHNEDREEVTRTISTKDLLPGTYDLEVVAKASCCEMDSMTTDFVVREPGRLYGLEVAEPRISMPQIYTQSCCSEDLRVETAIRVDEYNSNEAVGIMLNLYVYDNPDRTGSYVYTDSKSVTMGPGVARTAVFWVNPSYLRSGERYYFFIEATEREGVCFRSFTEWSDYAVLDVECESCGSCSSNQGTTVAQYDNTDSSGSGVVSATQSAFSFVAPSLSTLAVYALLAAIGLVSTVIIFKLTQGSSDSKRPM